MLGEIQSCQSWWLMLEVSFEQSDSAVASRGVGHNRTVSSVLAEARVGPSGLNGTLVTTVVWPVRGWLSGVGWVGLLRFHNRMVASVLPEARVCPSGLKATPQTVLVWPVRGWPSGVGWVGSVRSHNHTV